MRSRNTNRMLFEKGEASSNLCVETSVTHPYICPKRICHLHSVFFTYTFTRNFLNVSFPNIMVIRFHMHSSGTVISQGKILAFTFYSVSSGNTPPNWNLCVQLLPKYNSGKKKNTSVTEWRLLGRTFSYEGFSNVLFFWKTLTFIFEVAILIGLNVYFCCLLGICTGIFKHLRQKVNVVLTAFEM